KRRNAFCSSAELMVIVQTVCFAAMDSGAARHAAATASRRHSWDRANGRAGERMTSGPLGDNTTTSNYWLGHRARRVGRAGHKLSVRVDSACVLSSGAMSDGSIDSFIDALWLEEGLSKNTLAAYRRDLTMLEVIYASGLRVSELVGLKTFAVSMNEHVLRVTGKGGKERLVPFGQVAGDWIARYLRDARAQILGAQQTEDMFVTARGEGMTRAMFWLIVKKYA